jgi:putative flippase GtrA
MSQVSFWKSFVRSQWVALSATVVDYGTLLIYVEVFKGWYVLGTALGAFLGAVTSFVLGKFWTFKSRGALHTQAIRYTQVSLISLILNTGLVYVVTEFGRFDYKISKLIVALMVGVFFNFPLHRYYVFRHSAGAKLNK